MDVVLVLHNIRSTYNTGAILRTAEGLGVSKVICSGYTPCGLRPDLMPHLAEKIERRIAKTALGAEKMVNLSWSEQILGTLKELKTDGFVVVGLENNLTNRKPLILGGAEFSRWKNSVKQVVLILGEEVGGISQELYGEIDDFLEIPMTGQKESFNVSVAAGIAMFELVK